jgi:dynein heavy chain
MEPNTLGFTPLVVSWLDRLPPALTGSRQLLSDMAAALLPAGLPLVRKTLKETVATVNNNLVTSCLNVMDALLAPWIRPEGAFGVKPL